ncbi:hypothetical protein RUMLAC_02080 [[Ruminococcus] lactaris ATCC 29176]|uniref:Uncharacterized protein n=1 Tax=[Ruminococcus] lactaris ATCC 29176 TaxID=471875 RepID=B5CRH9_9FIRM|nr:hypothetical protein RUMLAC_02080 [[Ruminococcus] lactaris ATCC 29176]
MVEYLPFSGTKVVQSFGELWKAGSDLIREMTGFSVRKRLF